MEPSSKAVTTAPSSKASSAGKHGPHLRMMQAISTTMQPLIGEDLIDFVDRELFPYLARFRQAVEAPQTIEYKIGEVFTELRSKFSSGYILRDVIAEIDKLTFNTQDARHELSDLYETRIKRMGNAGRNGGEYYTPRPLIRAMIKVVAPKIGETIYDGAVGSAGFLCEAWEYMRQGGLSGKDLETLQSKTFYGQEKKSLAYIIGIINMILHGIEAPNLIRSNTLTENVMDIQDKERHDVILANPPFGGGERKEVQHNFPHPQFGDGVSVFAALHPQAESGWPRRNCHQEHLLEQYRQCQRSAQKGSAAKLQSA